MIKGKYKQSYRMPPKAGLVNEAPFPPKVSDRILKADQERRLLHHPLAKEPVVVLYRLWSLDIYRRMFGAKRQSGNTRHRPFRNKRAICFTKGYGHTSYGLSMGYGLFNLGLEASDFARPFYNAPGLNLTRPLYTIPRSDNTTVARPFVGFPVGKTKVVRPQPSFYSHTTVNGLKRIRYKSAHHARIRPYFKKK